MTNASNHTRSYGTQTLRQIFKAMDAHQAQEIREAIQGNRGFDDLGRTLEIGRRTKTPSAGRFSRTLQRGPSPGGRDEEQPPWEDPLNHRPAECTDAANGIAAFFRLGRDTRPQSRSCEHLRPSTQHSSIATGANVGARKASGETWKNLGEKLREPA